MVRGRGTYDTGGVVALAFFGAIGIAVLSGLATVFLAVVAAGTGSLDAERFVVAGIQMTLVFVAATLPIVYVAYVPDVYRRVWNALRRATGRPHDEVGSDGIVLAIDGLGAVLSTVGFAGLTPLLLGCKWGCNAAAPMPGFLPVARLDLTTLLSVILLAGYGLLAVGWVGEGLAATADG